MSLTRGVTVWCDGCGHWEQADLTAARLRRRLRARGWAVIRTVEGVRDYCPACVEKWGK